MKPPAKRNQTLHVPLPLDTFLGGLLRVDPKKLPRKAKKKGWAAKAKKKG